MSQSQESQFSIALSSYIDADNTDSLQIIHSDLGPDLSFSQQSFRSVVPLVADSDFTRQSIPPPPIPTSLQPQRVCPDRINAYLIYSDMTKDDFVT
jgi:hypothetical protein